MARFQPYSIAHLQLNLLHSFKAAKGNHYVVMWFQQIPLGHVWMNIENDFQQQSFFNNVQKSIWKAVEYYMRFCDDENWRSYLASNNFSALYPLLQKAIDAFYKQLDQNNTEKISIVICTRNRAKALHECLSSLLKTEDKNLEVIVVDNASDNSDTKKVVEQFTTVRYVFEPRKGLDIARNTGAKSARYNIIAYTDDDVKIPANWISNLRTCFGNPLTMAVTGLVLPYELNTEFQFVFEKEWSFNKGYLPVIFDHAYFLKHKEDGVPVWDIGAGANMAFRREAFYIAGLFDERLDVGAAGCSGDSEMWYRVLAEGWNCNYFPHLYVFHQHRRSLKELRSQLFNYMKGHVCALLIQHEKFAHEGNLNRIKKTLPAYYIHRIKNSVGKLFRREFISVNTEIKGCIAGKKYYQQHKNVQQHDHLDLPASLSNNIAIDDNAVVSVIIPCYNQGNFLPQAIESVFNQTYKKTEIIVIDDGSTDNTSAVCSFYNVRCIRVEKVGLPAARNIGVQHATGTFVVFLDADDFLYPNAVELNLYFFSMNSNAAFVSGAFDKIDENGKYLPAINAEPKSGFNYVALLEGNYIAMEATVMYRRDLFFYFCFDNQLQSCEDYDLNLKISRRFPVYHHANKIAVYRMHENNISKNKDLLLKDALRVLKKQKPFLLNEEEKVALEKGIINWNDYYSNLVI